MSSVSKKRHLACFLSFVFAFTAAYSQDAAPARSAANSDASSADESAIMLDGSTSGGSTAANAGKGEKTSTPSSVWILIRIVLVLALVCAGIYGVVYLLKKSSGGTAGNDPYLRNVASLYFSPNKSVQVVSLGDRAYMVGVTDQAINLIAEVTDRELVDAMNLASDKKNPIPKGTFQNLLANFFPGAKGPEGAAGNAGATGAAGNAGEPGGVGASGGAVVPTGAELIRAQRERLQRASRGEGASGSASGSPSSSISADDRGEA